MPVRGLRDSLPLHWDGTLGDPFGGPDGSVGSGGNTGTSCSAGNSHGCFRHLVDGSLSGVMCDQTPSCLSAVYFFYDPAWRDRSLGVFNVLYQVEYARALKLPHVYLGFRILECPSMRYKSTFRPHELLVGRPSFLEQPVWVPSEQHPSNALRVGEPTEE